MRYYFRWLAEICLLQGRDGDIGQANADDEVRALAEFLRQHARRMKRGERVVTFKDLRRCLEHFGYHLENPDDSFIEIVRHEQAKRGFLRREAYQKRVSVWTIPYQGENREVGLNLVKIIREKCSLREEDGVDSETFYTQGVVVDSFINKYRNTLRRLSKN